MKISITAHSVIDIITNSSTEIFICITNRSINTVRAILVELLKEFIATNEYGWNRSFDEVFEEPYIVGDKDSSDCCYYGQPGDIIIEGKSDQSIPSDLVHTITQTFDARTFHY